MSADATQLVSDIRDLPPFPAVALRVMAMVNDQDTTATQLGQVLATDQALTAKLLQISNSAAYARKVGSVREAVIVLGFQQVRQLAFVTSVITNFSRARRAGDGFDVDYFWSHNLRVACAAEAVAAKVGGVKPDDAFAAGVLHDMGRLALRLAMPAEFAAAVALREDGRMGLREAELLTTGYEHQEVGRALGELWHFPQEIIAAIADHHDESLSLRDGGIAGVVCWCDRLAAYYDAGAESAPKAGEAAPALVEAETLCGGWGAVDAGAAAMVAKVTIGQSKAAHAKTA